MFHPAVGPAQKGKELVQGGELAVDGDWLLAGALQVVLPLDDLFLADGLPGQPGGEVRYVVQVLADSGRLAFVFPQVPVESSDLLCGDLDIDISLPTDKIVPLFYRVGRNNATQHRLYDILRQFVFCSYPHENPQRPLNPPSPRSEKPKSA